jgi:hypothetical protein
MKRMPIKLLTLLGLSPLLVMGSTITWTGPDLPDGTACNPINITCVIGTTTQFNITSAALTTPATSGGTWNLTLVTDYPVTLSAGSTKLGANPNNLIPITPFESAGSFGMADFIIQLPSVTYGVVLSNHDGYNVGSLVQVNATGTAAYKTAGQILGAADPVSRQNLPAEIAAGGSLVSSVAGGTNAVTVSINPTADGITQGYYTISIDFSANSAFATALSTQAYKITVASYVCDNGFITANVTPSTPPPPGVPEPSTFLLLVPAVAALALRRVRK